MLAQFCGKRYWQWNVEEPNKMSFLKAQKNPVTDPHLPSFSKRPCVVSHWNAIVNVVTSRGKPWALCVTKDKSARTWGPLYHVSMGYTIHDASSWIFCIIIAIQFVCRRYTVKVFFVCVYCPIFSETNSPRKKNKNDVTDFPQVVAEPYLAFLLLLLFFYDLFLGKRATLYQSDQYLFFTFFFFNEAAHFRWISTRPQNRKIGGQLQSADYLALMVSNRGGSNFVDECSHWLLPNHRCAISGSKDPQKAQVE